MVHPVHRHDLRRIAVDIDEHAKKIRLAGECDLECNTCRPGRTAWRLLLTQTRPSSSADRRKLAVTGRSRCFDFIGSRFRPPSAAKISRFRDDSDAGLLPIASWMTRWA
jgi:hypothetical protein